MRMTVKDMHDLSRNDGVIIKVTDKKYNFTAYWVEFSYIIETFIGKIEIYSIDVYENRLTIEVIDNDGSIKDFLENECEVNPKAVESTHCY